MKFSSKLFFLLILILAVVVAGGAWLWSQPKQSSSPSLESPFEVSEKGHVFELETQGTPNFKSIAFDPLEVSPGAKQKLRIGIKSDSSLTKVSAEISCARSKEKELKQVKSKKSKISLWETTVIVSEQIKAKQCTAVFKAVEEKGNKNQFTFTWKVNK